MIMDKDFLEVEVSSSHDSFVLYEVNESLSADERGTASVGPDAVQDAGTTLPLNCSYSSRLMWPAAGES